MDLVRAATKFVVGKDGPRKRSAPAKTIATSVAMATTAAMTAAATNESMDGCAVLGRAVPTSPAYVATVVTGFYEFKSKNSKTQYFGWMETMLATDAPMVIYTSATTLHKVRQRRPKRLLPITKFICTTLDDFEWGKPLQQGHPHFWQEQYSKDPEAKRRLGAHKGVSPDLYRVWDSKLEMTRAVADANPFNTTHFFWMDIGSLRGGGTYDHAPWPAPERMALVPRGRVVVEEIFKGYLAGGLFGGDASAIRFYAAAFYAELYAAAAAKEFIGKDQNLMMRVLKKHPERFASIFNPQSNPNWFDLRCGSELGSWYIMVRVSSCVCGACILRWFPWFTKCQTDNLLPIARTTTCSRAFAVNDKWRWFAGEEDRRAHDCHSTRHALVSPAALPSK